MEDIVENPGLQHIIKTTLTFLDKSDIASFRLVNQYCKNIVDDPIFSLKKLSQLKDLPKDLIKSWMKNNPKSSTCLGQDQARNCK